MSQWTIAGLANAGGVSVETVRYYQRRGLLRTPERVGVRRYDESDLRRLRFIRGAKAAGFTLEEIRELLDLDATHDRDRARALARERIAMLDIRIEELNEARASLKRLAEKCGSGRAGPCPILTAFEHA